MGKKLDGVVHFLRLLAVARRTSAGYNAFSGGFGGVRGVRPHPPWRPSEKFMVYQFRKQ